MASYRGAGPESFTRSVNKSSDVLADSTYRPETASGYPTESTYRVETSSDQTSTSDSFEETRVPVRLKGYLKSSIIRYLSEAEDFTADILHIPGQPARLVLQLGAQQGKSFFSFFFKVLLLSVNNKRQPSRLSNFNNFQ